MDIRKFMRKIGQKGKIMVEERATHLQLTLQRDAQLWKEHAQELLSHKGHYPNSTAYPFKRTGDLSRSMHVYVTKRPNPKSWSVTVYNSWDELFTTSKKGVTSDYSNILEQQTNRSYGGFKKRIDDMLRKSVRDIMRRY